MTAREDLRLRTEKVKAELSETGRLVLRAPTLLCVAECAIRFFLTAVLSCATIFGEFAPFGAAMVAASGSGLGALASLFGALFGYLSFFGFVDGLRYVAASILIFSVSFAFFDIKLYRAPWFMPLAAAALSGSTGFVYLSQLGWSASSVIFFTTELLLTGAAVYFYRLAFSFWQGNDASEAELARRLTGLGFLCITILIALAGLTLPGALSVGRILAVLAVLAFAYKGGMGLGAAAGVCAGLAMDLSAAAPFYSMAYGFSGLLAGTAKQRSRLQCTLFYFLANAVVVLWTWESGLRISILYEVFLASVVFLLFPERFLLRLGSILEPHSDGGAGTERARRYVQDRLVSTSAAFRSLYETMRTSFRSPPPNDSDVATVFDRCADRVCRCCSLRSACWERDYVTTWNALNDASPVMLERGRCEGDDFPSHFSSRCLHFPRFLTVTNEELTALLSRRQFQSRLQESRRAVCRQYAELSTLLETAAAELGQELMPDVSRENRLRQHLAELELTGDTAVYYDEAGHLRVEISSRGCKALTASDQLARLSSLMGVPLQSEKCEGDRLVLTQLEPLCAVLGVSAHRKNGESVSGDAGTCFKTADGNLYLLLCDGMGSGSEARRDSEVAVRMLEEFLKAGVSVGDALSTMSTALALRAETECSFTTIDLLRVDLFSGEGAVYKLGAAPTYLRQNGTVTRITGSALPAGLVSGDGASPDTTRLHLSPGDCVLLISDGVVDADNDKLIREQLLAFDGKSPKDLACQLLQDAPSEGTTDDRTVLLMKLEARA